MVRFGQFGEILGTVQPLSGALGLYRHYLKVKTWAASNKKKNSDFRETRFRGGPAAAF